MGRGVRQERQQRLVLDTGALIALERGDRRIRSQLSVAGSGGVEVVVSVLPVMEALAGTRDPVLLHRVLAAVDSELSLHPPVAHQAVALRARAGRGSHTDAVVVLEALAVPGSAILSSDPEDMHALLAAAGATGRVPVLRA
jgi:hypothetical protein